jgi:hypothetical protein
MDDVHNCAIARKAGIEIPKRSRGRQSVAARLAYQERRGGPPPDRGNPGKGGNSPPLGGAMTAPSTAVSAAIPLAIVAEPIHDPAWWTEESARVGSDWGGIIATHIGALAELGLIEREAGE